LGSYGAILMPAKIRLSLKASLILTNGCAFFGREVNLQAIFKEMSCFLIHQHIQKILSVFHEIGEFDGSVRQLEICANVFVFLIWLKRGK
jgi:hypothetical protein